MTTNRSLRALALAAALCLGSAPLLAQALPRPEGWRVRVDGTARDTVHYVRMPPGWHMTTGPGALLYDPAYRASGRYAIEAEIFLFPGTSQSGYGIFVGGEQLEDGEPRYLALLIRRDGQVALERVQGASSTLLSPWAAAPAVRPHPGGDEVVQNVIRLSVERDSLVVEANAARVLAVPRDDWSLDGTFGFRVGADVNLHASRLDHVRRLAPVPPRKAS